MPGFGAHGTTEITLVVRDSKVIQSRAADLLPGQALAEDAAESPDVSPLIHGLAPCLLQTHVLCFENRVF